MVLCGASPPSWNQRLLFWLNWGLLEGGFGIFPQIKNTHLLNKQIWLRSQLCKSSINQFVLELPTLLIDLSQRGVAWGCPGKKRNFFKNL